MNIYSPHSCDCLTYLFKSRISVMCFLSLSLSVSVRDIVEGQNTERGYQVRIKQTVIHHLHSFTSQLLAPPGRSYILYVSVCMDVFCHLCEDHFLFSNQQSEDIMTCLGHIWAYYVAYAFQYLDMQRVWFVCFSLLSTCITPVLTCKQSLIWNNRCT